jgi:hypothetical protein
MAVSIRRSSVVQESVERREEQENDHDDDGALRG